MLRLSSVILMLPLLLRPHLALAETIELGKSPAANALPGEIAVAPAPAMAPAAEDAALKMPMRFSLAPGSDGQNLSLYVQKGVTKLGPGNLLGEGYYEPLCHGPCEFKLRPGAHMFAVTNDGGRTIKLPNALRIERGQELLVAYKSRRAHRIAGWCLLAGLVAAGVSLYALAQPDADDEDGKLKTGYVVGGSVLVVSGLLSGLWMANLPDKAMGWVRD